MRGFVSCEFSRLQCYVHYGDMGNAKDHYVANASVYFPVACAFT